MDHHHHPIHWGYSSTPTQQNTWIPPQPVKKRTISDSECDDVYSEESSSKEHYDIVSPERSSTGESDSCQLLSRKRRRGVIEKKRRDKINSSLSELKRLVPTAYEKQGSAKLEKAEILQLTVDHLKGLHAKGIDSMSIDPQRYALEYNIIGLRECAAEVSRYLVTIEGMDIQDPLRLRLMSHLQCFVTQREISAKNGTATSSWVPSTYQSMPSPSAYGPPLPPPPTTSASTSSTYHQNYLPSQPSTSSASLNSYIPNIPPSSVPLSPTHIEQHCNTSVPMSSTTTTNTTALLHPSTHAPSTSHHHHHHPHHPHQHHHNLHHDPYNQYPITHDSQQGSIYTDLSSSRGSLPALGYPQYPPTAPQGYPPYSGSLPVGSYNGNTMKPYRPWGAEMAY